MSKLSNPKPKTITASVLKYAIQKTLDRAQKGRATIITRFGHEVAVVIGVAEWKRLKALEVADGLALIAEVERLRAENACLRAPGVIHGTMDGGRMAADGLPAFVTVYTTDAEVGNIPLGSNVRVVREMADV